MFNQIDRCLFQNNDEFSGKTFLAAVGSIFGILALALSENYLSATTIMIPMSILVSISIGLYWQENI